MMNDIAKVFSGEKDWAVTCDDAGRFLDGLPEKSVSLIFSSPPYERQRLYLEDGQNLGIARDTEEWTAWMVELTRKALRVTTGLVAWVVEGCTDDFSYSASPLLLAADLVRAGVCLRKPPLYVRDGIPGSGGPDWLKNKYEFIICATNGGNLPWSDNAAMGHVPTHRAGGKPSHRTKNGKRVDVQTRRKANGKRLKDGEYVDPNLANPGNLIENFGHAKDGTVKGGHARDICETANPGNLIDCGSAGGGNISRSKLAHDNEAPFPEFLAEFMIRSFAKPSSVVCDPFSGSGTTLVVAQRFNRKFVGCDLRASQVLLAERRMTAELGMFVQSKEEAVEVPKSDLFADSL